MRVLIAEDEKRLSMAVVKLMEKNAFEADAVFDGDSALDYAGSGIYDLVILDIMLPKVSGLEVLEKMRREGIKTPVIMLTARQDLCVRSLDAGADDYLKKPYTAEELMARVRAVLRRKGELGAEQDILSFGDLELLPFQMKLKCKGAEVTLTKKELGLMQYLMANRGIVVSKEQIIQKLWGFDSEAEANHVEVYISFLRKKLSFLKSSVKVDTVRSVGYKLTIKEE